MRVTVGCREAGEARKGELSVVRHANGDSGQLRLSTDHRVTGSKKKRTRGREGGWLLKARERRTSPIHLNSPKPLLLPPRALQHIARFIAPHPSIHPQPIAHFSTEELIDRHVEFLAFDVPEGDIEAGEG